MNPIIAAAAASFVLMVAFWLMRDYDWQTEDDRPPLRLRFTDREGEDDE